MMKSYNAKECTITVDGVYVTGVAESMVTGEKDEDFFTTSVGAQGDTVVNEINNELGTITITLQATSPQNAYFIELANARKTVSLWVNNKSLNERMGGTMAKLKTFPSLEEGAEAGDRAYGFQVFDYTVTSG